MNMMPNRAPAKTMTPWIVLALISHTAWGGYPVLARYLQNTHHIGTMSLSAMTNILAVAVILAMMIRKIDMKTIGFKDFLVYALIVVSRGLLNLYAARLTYATNVQLFSLLAPFIVAFLSATFLKESLPKHTVLALCCSLSGSLLMILGAGNPGSASKVSPAANWVGIGLSIVGAVLLAFLMLAIKSTMKKGASSETLAFVQFISLAVCMSAGSIGVGEDWRPWLTLPLSGIAAYLAFAIVVLLLGTILQNNSVKHLGAATYSTIQAWRLTSTIAFSWILLGEGISSFLQGLGAFIVMATVTLYMLSQKKERAARTNAEIEPIGN
ncbi:MAG TPA: DMT family transporter [Rectinemataceae bacterium]|nr:DMT family transporter [Rectinemataceae bacterium]